MANNALFEPGAGTPTAWPDNRLLAAPPSMADAYEHHAQALQQWMAEQRASGVAAGTNDPETGWPTQKGIIDGVRQWGDAMIAGTNAPGFRAYHGSGADFNAFSNKYIGTGEGVQAYGFGHYVAGAESTGQYYRDTVGGSGVRMVGPDGATIKQGQPGEFVGPLMDEMTRANIAGPGYVKTSLAKAHISGAPDLAAATFKNAFGDMAMSAENEAKAKALIADTIQQAQPILDRHQFRPPGHMYEVQVNADPAHFLDWDKPRDQQPANVQAFAREHYPAAWDKAADGSSLYQHMVKQAEGPVRGAARAHDDAAQFLADWRMSSGGDRASALANIDTQLAQVAEMGRRYTAKGLSLDGTQYAVRAKRLNEIQPLIADPGWSPEKPPAANAHAIVTQQMEAAGIPGIRYLDGGSRADGAGTSNHVIFDPATIEILRKYGIAGLIAGGGAAAAAKEQ